MTGPRIGSLFSGYGGLEQGVQSVVGGTVAWHSEIDPGACKILAHRYPDVPNLGDITAVDWSAVEPVDVLTGGFPCQDVSAAGKRAGIRPGTRSGLWTQFAYAIDQLRPSLVVVENVRGLLSAAAEHPAHGDLEPCPWCLGDDEPVTLRALGAVLGDLAELGYDASWQGLRAADVGAPHGRYRVFVVAWPVADAERDRWAGWPEAPAGGRANGGGSRTAVARRGADLAAHACRLRSERRRGHGVVAGPSGASEAHGAERERHGDAADDRSAVAADADRGGRQGFGLAEPAWVGSARRGEPDGRTLAWGQYEPSIRHWERVLGRPAPTPTELGPKGSPRLSPRFVEWLMGLPAGWVTDVPGLTRNEQLKALGNGVVSQQCAAALRLLLPDAGIEVAA